ncbi:uncharacterized protein B0H18DRAFT_1034437 [Fomitopsis serialis]|uniref:uncharacterized protein n=1 Tax=Fomitopsis serialis TaxID=139415 RepID=UPI0020079735|nr:uncharacterized protein B0H18DRAFT_1034437 [Neoantrodia serialis]KAH9917515.1 hypothetical protein B0H18DRAFT_1034437 [Neoantrodia serialis]
MANWPSTVVTTRQAEMKYMNRLAEDFPNHELESDMHPFTNAGLSWASMQSCAGKPYTIRTNPQLTMSLPHNYKEVPEPTNRRTRSQSVQDQEPEVPQAPDDATGSDVEDDLDDAVQVALMISTSSTGTSSSQALSELTAEPTATNQHGDSISAHLTSGAQTANQQLLDDELAERYRHITISGVSSLLSSQSTEAPSTARRTKQQDEAQRRARDPRRTPDFTTRMTFFDPHPGYDRPLFLHECKRVAIEGKKDKGPDGYHALEIAFENMVNQTLQQAQFAFHEYPAETEIHIMCHVGLHFRVLKYDVDHTPKFGDPLPVNQSFSSVPVYTSPIWTVLNAENTDFHTQFKILWTKVKHSKEGTLE